jgi:GntR family transcriptional regulator/MocR family aminotransferase
MELHVSLIGRTNVTREIYRQLRRVILDGQLRPGDLLPPSRVLARSINAVTRDFAEHLEVIPSAVGLHVAAVARSGSPDQIGAVVRRAADAGVELLDLSRFAVDRPAPAGLLVGYGAIPTAHIEEGLHRLRSCFDG